MGVAGKKGGRRDLSTVVENVGRKYNRFVEPANESRQTVLGRLPGVRPINIVIMQQFPPANWQVRLFDSFV